MANPPSSGCRSLVVGSDSPRLAEAVLHALDACRPEQDHRLALQEAPPWFPFTPEKPWGFSYYWPLCATAASRFERVLWVLPRPTPDWQGLASPLRWLMLRQHRANFAPSRIGVVLPGASSSDALFWRRLGCVPVRANLASILRFQVSDEQPALPKIDLAGADLYRACLFDLIHQLRYMLSDASMRIEGYRDFFQPLLLAIANDLDRPGIDLALEKPLLEAIQQQTGLNKNFLDALASRYQEFNGACEGSRDRVMNHLVPTSQGRSPTAPSGSQVAVFVLDHPAGGARHLVAALQYLGRSLCARPIEVCLVGPEEARTISGLIRERGPAAMFVATRATTAAAGVFSLVRIPAVRQICEAVAEAQELSESDLKIALAAFFDAPLRFRGHLHDLVNDLTRGLAGDEARRFQDDLLKLRQDLHLFGPSDDASYAAGMTDLASDTTTPEEDRVASLHKMLVELGRRLVPDWGQSLTDDGPDPPGNPPDGFGTILAADDDGCAPEWQRCLEDLGYGVETVDSIKAARATLRANPGSVFVCDLHWRGAPPEEVRGLLQLARSTRKCKIILVVSTSPLKPGDVPEADDVYGGIEAKFAAGARRIHRQIWTWSKTRAGATNES